MQALDAAPSRDVVVWAAEATLRMHTQSPDPLPPRGCKQCTPQGTCAARSWAQRVMSYLADRPATTAQQDTSST